MATADEWRQRGMEAIHGLVQREEAVTQMEMEAKLADKSAGPATGLVKIQPHHLTRARQRLLDAGVIHRVRERTRGGTREIATFSFDPDVKKARRAAARKRLLQARFLSWSLPSSDWGNAPPVPAALERVVQASLLQAAPYGYRLARPEGGEVRTLLGSSVPGGSLDNAAFYTGLDAHGSPTSTIVVPVEAKNLRQWVYPQTQELFQLLDKSARMQVAHPSARFVPVLVCREKHHLTGVMANQMGFHVIATWRQYVRPIAASYDEGARERFDQVGDELGFNLELREEAVGPMIDHFTKHLPKRADEASRRWAAICGHPDVPALLHVLRNDDLAWTDRHMLLVDLGNAVGQALGEDVKWSGHSSTGEEPADYRGEDHD